MSTCLVPLRNDTASLLLALVFTCFPKPVPLSISATDSTIFLGSSGKVSISIVLKNESDVPIRVLHSAINSVPSLDSAFLLCRNRLVSGIHVYLYRGKKPVSPANSQITNWGEALRDSINKFAKDGKINLTANEIHLLKPLDQFVVKGGINLSGYSLTPGEYQLKFVYIMTKDLAPLVDDAIPDGRTPQLLAGCFSSSLIKLVVR